MKYVIHYRTRIGNYSTEPLDSNAAFRFHEYLKECENVEILAVQKLDN